MQMAIGTTSYHKFSQFPAYPVITDGVLALAEAAECFWLLDVIGSYQPNPKLNKEFQVWELKVNRSDQSAVVCGHNDTELIVTQNISYTNFPLDKLTLFLEYGVLLLPSEH
jgi:hypothetical protein